MPIDKRIACGFIAYNLGRGQIQRDDVHQLFLSICGVKESPKHP